MTPNFDLKDILIRIHDTAAHAFNHAMAVEKMLAKHPDLQAEYRKALSDVESQALHQDFGALIERIP
jgi:hypothetical protein